VSIKLKLINDCLPAYTNTDVLSERCSGYLYLTLYLSGNKPVRINGVFWVNSESLKYMAQLSGEELNFIDPKFLVSE